MKKGIKIALIIALSLLGVGVLLTAISFAMVGFHPGGWNGFEEISNTYQIEQPFTNIDADAVEADIRVQKSDTGKAYVVCREADKITHHVKVENGRLKITRQDLRSWWEHVGIFWAEMSVTVYLPEAEYGDFHMESVSGKLYLSGVEAENVRMNAVSGDIKVEGVYCNDLSLKTTSGNITLSDVASQGRVSFESTSGEVDWNNGTGDTLQISSVSGNVEINACKINEEVDIHTTSGEIRLTSFDAENLTLSSTSGNIYAIFLCDKQYQTSTVSGNIDVPSNGGSGRCKMSTVSGNIRVTVEK